VNWFSAGSVGDLLVECPILNTSEEQRTEPVLIGQSPSQVGIPARQPSLGRPDRSRANSNELILTIDTVFLHESIYNFPIRIIRIQGRLYAAGV